MGHVARMDALKAKHAEIDVMLEREEARPLPDNSLIHELKRKKLKIKDELQRIVLN